ncbi:family 2 glycosyl transferase [Flammeovirgaceae bacterium 311]|nr:family 2 glycosyl transferase [Flammeovirgaceae bacterium 311]
MLILLLLLIAIPAYWLALEYLRKQWFAIPQPPAGVSLKGEACTISVVVVVRNEARNLSHLFQALQAQSLTSELFELHLVDDGSTDDTGAIAAAFRDTARFKVHVHRLQQLVRGSSPKKAAITQVMEYTRGKLIAVTDGDCVPEPHWLSSLLALWQQQQPLFISGAVRYAGEQTLFGKLQVLDFVSLIGVGAAMLQAGRPGMCNAANMAFSKEAFLAAGGYAGNEHVPSGDDEFLLQKLAKQAPESIVFMKAAGAVVSTAPCASWQEFLQQRKRWAGKWHLHKGIASKLPAVVVFLFYLLLTAAYVQAVWQPSYIPLILLLLFVKALADYRFLAPILYFLKKPLSLKVFMLMELVYPFYVLFFAFAANTGSFTWKERSYRYTTTQHERTGVSRAG